MRFVNPSDAFISGELSDADACEEVEQRALMFAVWTVCFCNPASSLPQKTDGFSWVWLKEWPERGRETTKKARQGQQGKQS